MSNRDELLGSTTTTAENRMTKAEIDDFLTKPFIGRLATNRPDGFPHVTPVWPAWDGKVMLFVLGENRIHTRNLRVDPKATLIVDEDWRPRNKRYGAGAAAVIMRGTVTLTDLDASEKALGPIWTEHANKFLDGAVGDEDFWSTESGERYHVCTLVPSIIVTWDFRKFHSS